MSASNINSHRFVFDARQACIEHESMAVFIPTDPVMLLLVAASSSAMFVMVNKSTDTYVTNS